MVKKKKKKYTCIKNQQLIQPHRVTAKLMHQASRDFHPFLFITISKTCKNQPLGSQTDHF